MKKPLYRHRWFRIVGIALACFVLLLIVLPYAISYGTQRWVLANGGENVEVTDVDFNPFSGTLVYEGVQVRVDEKSVLDVGRARLKLAWFPLFKRWAHIRAISLEDFNITVDREGSGALRIGGISIPESQDDTVPEAPWLFGIDQVAFEDCAVRYSEPGLKTSLVINNLTLSDLAQWTPDRAAELHLEGSLNGSELLIDGVASPFAEEPQFHGRINLSGLQLEEFASLAEPSLTALEGILTLNSKVKIHRDRENAFAITQEGMISIGRSRVVAASEKGSLENLIWEGTSSTAVLHENNGFLSRAEGKLSLKALEAGLSKKDLSVRGGSALWKGTVSLDGRGDILGITVTGGLGLRDFEANAEERKINLLSIESLDAKSISLEALDRLNIAEVVLKGLILARGVGTEEDGQSNASLTQAKEMIISNIGFDGDTGLSIDSISEKDLQAVISRDRNGQWNAVRIIDILASLAEGETEPGKSIQAEQDAEDSDKPRHSEDGTGFQVGRILVAGDSALTFSDQTAQPPFLTTLQIVSARVENINTARPDEASAISIEGRVGKHAKAQISGTIRPFATPAAYELKGNVEGYELPALSSYTMKELGFEVSSGQLDTDFTVTADKGLLDGKAEITIRQLKLGKEDKSRLAALEQNLSVPLNVALKMLEDKNKTVRLVIPFRGEPNNPDFDFSDAINQALASAMKKGAMTYLTLALQPYGSLIMLAQYAGDAATRVKLNPVFFVPGVSAVGPESVSYLEKIATVLRDRPGLNIGVCGVAVRADLTALPSEITDDAKEKELSEINTAETEKGESSPGREELLNALAKERADAVKDYLVTELGADANRLIACTPYLDMDKEHANPRVDLLI